MDNGSLLKRFEEAYTKEPHTHFRSLLIAGLNAIPAVGGTISSLVNDYIPNARQERVLSFIKEIALEIDKLKILVDHNKIHTDSFAYIFEKTLRSVSLNYQKAKIEAYKSIILNSLIINAESDEKKEYFFNLVDSFTPLHILVIKAVRNPQKIKKYHPTKGDDIVKVEEEHLFSFPVESYSDELIMSVWADLHSKGLVKETKTTIENSTGDESTVKGELTEFGKDFINFITAPR